MDLKIAAGYVRVSSDDQLEYSPASQLKIIRDYAMRDGYIIPDEYVYQDDGISGKRAEKRPAFMRMIAEAKQSPPQFTAIFVWKYSRFARNQEESIVYKNLLRKNGVTVNSVSEPSTDSPFSGLIESVISWMDEYYLINLSTEVRRGMKEKASRGEATGKAPFGYSVENKQFVPNADADIVRYIFEKYNSGANIHTLCRMLAQMGVKTQTGASPSNRWVRYILSNPTYIGKIRWSTEGKANYNRACENLSHVEYYAGKHPPIIDIETWNAVQEKLKTKAEPKYMRNGGNMFMLRGLVRCSNCNSTLVYGTGRFPQLQCGGYRNGSCLVSHSISVKKANEAILGALDTAIGSETFVFSPARRVEAPKPNWDKLIASENQRLERAKNALLDGALTSAEYKDAKAQIEKNIEHIKENMAQAEVNPEVSPEYITKCKTVMEVLRSNAQEEVKNAALRSIVDRIVFDRSENHFDIFFLH